MCEIIKNKSLYELYIDGEFIGNYRTYDEAKSDYYYIIRHN